MAAGGVDVGTFPLFFVSTSTECDILKKSVSISLLIFPTNMTKFRAIIASFFLAFSMFSFAAMAAPSAFAAPLAVPTLDANTLGVPKAPNSSGNGVDDLNTFFKKAVQIVMGFLGMIAVGIILFAGFKWMTAGGNDEAVEGAQKMLIQGVVGLVIIIAAYLIAGVVINIIVGFVNGPVSG